MYIGKLKCGTKFYIEKSKKGIFTTHYVFSSISSEAQIRQVVKENGLPDFEPHMVPIGEKYFGDCYESEEDEDIIDDEEEIQKRPKLVGVRRLVKV